METYKKLFPVPQGPLRPPGIPGTPGPRRRRGAARGRKEAGGHGGGGGAGRGDVPGRPRFRRRQDVLLVRSADVVRGIPGREPVRERVGRVGGEWEGYK